MLYLIYHSSFTVQKKCKKKSGKNQVTVKSWKYEERKKNILRPGSFLNQARKKINRVDTKIISNGQKRIFNTVWDCQTLKQSSSSLVWVLNLKPTCHALYLGASQKYSKHWLCTVTHTIDCVCSKMLNHGLFLSLFKLIPCPIHWIVNVLGAIQVLRHHVFDFFRPTHPPLWWRNTWMVP